MTDTLFRFDEYDSPVSWITRGTSKTSCNHLGGVEVLFQAQLCYVLCEHKWYHMSEMHAIAAGSTAGVQEEGLALLIPIEDFVQLP